MGTCPDVLTSSWVLNQEGLVATLLSLDQCWRLEKLLQPSWVLHMYLQRVSMWLHSAFVTQEQLACGVLG